MKIKTTSVKIHFSCKIQSLSSQLCVSGPQRGREERGRGLLQSWEDHSENHPTLNPPGCSRKMTGLACHGWQYGHIWLQPGTSTTYSVLHFTYIKRSMKNRGIKARKMLDCHHLYIRPAKSCEIQCLYPCCKCPCTSISPKLFKCKSFKTSGPSVIGFLE